MAYGKKKKHHHPTAKGHSTVIAVVKRRFGMQEGSLRDVAEKVAAHYGTAVPLNKFDKWVLLRKFYVEHNPTERLRAPAIPVRGTSRPFAVTDAFLASYEWRALRMIVLKKFGARCQACGATPADGIRIHVDHIKPRKHHPELALEESNLQVLCEVCNHGKGNWDETDWRQKTSLREVLENDKTWAV